MSKIRLPEELLPFYAREWLELTKNDLYLSMVICRLLVHEVAINSILSWFFDSLCLFFINFVSCEYVRGSICVAGTTSFAASATPENVVISFTTIACEAQLDKAPPSDVSSRSIFNQEKVHGVVRS